ncbi:gluconokinase [Herbiconiux daphne]|uniref:Gluconokinase n=1 Tax=Herbiconiux daphne TaxID=2970914 RepID=A0ABT2H8U4_9MICO|nr:gluconokinase [Herbiconiux daphne]MCS5736354.1 gluconokinase [Herbiconiux daphne]
MTNAPADSPVSRIVVMGVSGSGKSLIGSALAARLGWAFVDADDLHPVANVAKMTAGTPLTDDDRWPWLDIVAQTLAASGTGMVIACSALRRAYRDRIRTQAPDAVFLELVGTPELLAARVSGRTAHFMPVSLLASQLATLESLGDDERGALVDIDGTPGEVLERAIAAVAAVGEAG